jgi:hypothetical protein
MDAVSFKLGSQDPKLSLLLFVLLPDHFKTYCSALLLPFSQGSRYNIYFPTLPRRA